MAFKKGHIGYKGMLGKHPSEETRRLIYQANKDKHNSPQTEFKKGQHHSPKTEFKKGCTPWIKGKHMSKESIEKMRFKRIGQKLSKEQIKNCLQRRTPSSLEKKFSEITTKLNLPYKFVGDGKFFIERKNPDFINTNGEKIAVEVYYRRHKEEFAGGVEKWKNERLRLFNKYGWTIKFFNEIEVNEEEIKNRLGINKVER